MWSGPRNISTAMMRAWGSLRGTHVVDEPFYAFYLDCTGLDHPGREDILRSQPTDWREVAEAMTRGSLPEGATRQYQKHMTHHLLPEVDPSALDGLRHAFLIRDPAEVLVSYAKVRGEPTLDDLGFPQQVALYERFGGPVVDARDVLERPEQMLRALCGSLDVEYDEAMLHWEAGPRPTDGVWGPHWYDGVWRSTGFAPYRPPQESVPARLQPLLERCRPYYDTMAEHRLSP
jgi:Sulfotransferase domain